MRRELEERKRFYLPSQLMRNEPHEPRKERRVPSKIKAYADMFYWGSDEIAFGKKSTKRIGFVNREKSDSSVIAHVVETSAISGNDSVDKDPLAYIPELDPIEDLDLPDILPDLPGIEYLFQI
ncbi:unnamed protein product [Nippostrongylus brasiliensis]|uniref:Pre-mRNA-splicing factor SLU7 n=1 Tax=Nippostrongylus brasiliensis TaxID=27835 RepID=A0A0N4XGW6_NIPBR|nr:unnamed protein product [Nippostrongylus brasiliensis]